MPQISPLFSLRSQLATTSAVNGKDAFELGGLYHQALSLYVFGEKVDFGALDRLLARLPDGSSVTTVALSLENEA
ncbi:MAG: hypothetical protein AAB037_01330, partial [Chloroflexota bacterium]